MEPERIATWWIRWNDLNWPNPDTLDRIRRRAEGFARADVSAAMLFGAHFRWDYLPVFPLLHDYIAQVVEELHGYGIKVFDHHSVDLVHRYHNRQEMRHVMLDSGPHLPFSPTFEAAESWQYKGKRLNDWRMLDVHDGKPLYFPQYTAQCFCFRNPEFVESYIDYAKYLVRETGIDGLEADDATHFLGYNSCACPHCRAELKRRAGIDLPPVEEGSDFWGNWNNPAWKAWIDLRFDTVGEFFVKLRAALPEPFMLATCGGSSAAAGVVATAADARQSGRGCSYTNMELVGNTPPYKGDPMTVNVPIRQRLSNASHHAAVARGLGSRFYNTGFAFTTVAADHVWALCKVLGGDAWIGTLKGRLGLPDHILETLPNEEDIVGEAFGFEKRHPELFAGQLAGQAAVLFSYETRNHTLMGSLMDGYSKDYGAALTALFRAGICPHTVFEVPKGPEEYPVLILASVANVLPQEREALERYRAAGGKVIVTGPSPLPGCENHWVLPTRAESTMAEFFPTVPDGVHVKGAAWPGRMKLPPCPDPDEWREPEPGLHYHPGRVSEGACEEGLVALCRRYARPTPVRVVEAQGYLSSLFEGKDGCVVQLLAEEFDVDIDHKLDDMRTHRSRVNFVNKAEPVGVSGVVRVEAKCAPEVYTPFSEEKSEVRAEEGGFAVTLPEKCSYAILRFPAQ